MTNGQIVCYLSNKEDATVGLYEDIQDFDCIIKSNLERTETVGEPRAMLTQLLRANGTDR